MKRILLSLLVILSAAISPLLAQCPSCPSNDNNCESDVNCCLVELNGSSMNDCITSGATIIRVTVTSTIGSGQSLAGRSLCIQGAVVNIDPSTTVDDATCIEANGNNGVSVTVGGTTYDFSANDGTLDMLNAAFGALGSGSTIGTVAASLPVELKAFSVSLKDDKTNEIK